MPCRWRNAIRHCAGPRSATEARAGLEGYGGRVAGVVIIRREGHPAVEREEVVGVGDGDGGGAAAVQATAARRYRNGAAWTDASAPAHGLGTVVGQLDGRALAARIALQADVVRRDGEPVRDRR